MNSQQLVTYALMQEVKRALEANDNEQAAVLVEVACALTLEPRDIFDGPCCQEYDSSNE